MTNKFIPPHKLAGLLLFGFLGFLFAQPVSAQTIVYLNSSTIYEKNVPLSEGYYDVVVDLNCADFDNQNCGVYFGPGSNPYQHETDVEECDPNLESTIYTFCLTVEESGIIVFGIAACPGAFANISISPREVECSPTGGDPGGGGD